jgi:hypothetical protein
MVDNEVAEVWNTPFWKNIKSEVLSPTLTLNLSSDGIFVEFLHLLLPSTLSHGILLLYILFKVLTLSETRFERNLDRSEDSELMCTVISLPPLVMKVERIERWNRNWKQALDLEGSLQGQRNGLSLYHALGIGVYEGRSLIHTKLTIYSIRGTSVPQLERCVQSSRFPISSIIHTHQVSGHQPQSPPGIQ